MLLRNLRLFPDKTESWAEDIYLRISRESGFPEPIQQYETRTSDGWFICRCDFAYPYCRLAIWIDGFAHHGNAEAFQTDRVQGNELSLLGWRYLRFTYFDLTQRPQYVMQQVRSALRFIPA
ncbi:MAG: endonuclease domain-containing protein [Acidimicrobiia bacterium]